jgi:hypothetical protein
MRPARLIDVSLTRLGRADQETSYETLVKQPMPDHCWQLWFFQGVLRGPRNLGTLLYIHQTRRSRDAPGFLRHFPTPGSIIKVQGEVRHTLSGVDTVDHPDPCSSGFGTFQVALQITV